MATEIRGGDPIMDVRKDGTARICFREYIADISGSVGFNVTQFSINPALPIFPWASGVFNRYEKWRPKKMRFELLTQSSTTATGTILLAPDFDATDSAPASKAQALNYRPSSRSAPWQNLILDVPARCMGKDLFCRSGLNPAGTDRKLYDLCTLNVCTQGQASTAVVAELHILYEIEALIPQVGNVAVGNALSGNYTGTSNSAPFSTQANENNIQLTYSSSGTTSSVSTFTFNQNFNGLLDLTVAGTGLSSTSVSGTATISTPSLVTQSNTAQGYSAFVSAKVGDTIIFTIANTTISNAYLSLYQGPVPSFG